MKEKDILDLLKKTGAIITDSHIVYTSGRHGKAYVNKDALYVHAGETSKLCSEMAALYQDEDIDVVAGPAIGGVILSQWIAYHLSNKKGKEVLSVFAEEDESKARIFKRGYDKLIKGKRVLVVEDVLTTGGSVKRLVQAVHALGGRVVGCVAICNRGGASESDIGGAPLKALINLEFESWDEADCPLCRENVPVNTDVGKGREYLKKRGELKD